MTSIARPFVALAPLALLAACGEPRIEPTPEQTEPQIPSSTPGSPSPPAPAGSPASYVADDPEGDLPASMPTPGPVPLAYRHFWAIDSADCTREPALTRIAIAPGAITFYEGRAAVLSATENASGLTLAVEHTAEGETSTQTHALSLDEAGSSLTYARNGQVFLYQLCP